VNIIEQLRSVACFSTLHDTHLAVLAASLGTQTFERGETIFHQGSIGSVLYIIVTGQVRIYTINEHGQELSMTIFRAGDFFGELALLDGQPRSANAVAMSRTTALLLHRSAFLSIIHAHPSIAVAILEALAQRLRQSTNHVDTLGINSAPQRVMRQLLSLAMRYGLPESGATRINLHLTQDDLASLTGTTRETVNRVLSSLRDQGLIRVARARISVLDMSGLEQAAGLS
jgi:CRP-like cAMP-binding protein